MVGSWRKRVVELSLVQSWRESKGLTVKGPLQPCCNGATTYGPLRVSCICHLPQVAMKTWSAGWKTQKRPFCAEMQRHLLRRKQRRRPPQRRVLKGMGRRTDTGAKLSAGGMFAGWLKKLSSVAWSRTWEGSNGRDR